MYYYGIDLTYSTPHHQSNQPVTTTPLKISSYVSTSLGINPSHQHQHIKQQIVSKPRYKHISSRPHSTFIHLSPLTSTNPLSFHHSTPPQFRAACLLACYIGIVELSQQSQLNSALCQMTSHRHAPCREACLHR